MSNDNNKGHPPLPPALANALLDLLSSDDEYRELFVRDPHSALMQAGLSAQQADAALAGESCMRTDQLASKEDIAAAREALLENMTSLTAHYVPFCLPG